MSLFYAWVSELRTNIHCSGCTQSQSINALYDTYSLLVCTDGFAYRSDNFIVGLTNVSPLISRPILWNYTLCGQYPGAVPASATVSLYCPYNLPPFRYVIVQFPRNDRMNICELEVIAPGTRLSNIPSICCFTDCDWCLPQKPFVFVSGYWVMCEIWDIITQV